MKYICPASALAVIMTMSTTYAYNSLLLLVKVATTSSLADSKIEFTCTYRNETSSGLAYITLSSHQRDGLARLLGLL